MQTVIDRLRDPRAITATVGGRRQRAGRLVVVHARTAPVASTRVAVVASRRVGDAVARNRAKRLLREAARAIPWRAGTDVVLVARRPCVDSTLHEVEPEVRALAAEVGALDAGEDGM